MSSTGRRWFGAAAPWLAPALLVLLALNQLALVRRSALSPWKGGGFGMFATTDHGASRELRILALDARGERAVAIPNWLTRRRDGARELPSDANLVRFARELAAADPEAVADATALRIEVWRTEYDRETLEPRLRLLRARRVEIRDGG